MTRLLLTALLLLAAAACDDTPPPTDGTDSACVVRAYAVCDAYSECGLPGDYEDCFAGNVGFCRTAVAPPGFERAVACAEEVESVNACETLPRSCSLH